MLVVLSGSGGAGKNTIINALLNMHSDYSQFLSYTTRQPRAEEKTKPLYNYISKAEFLKKIEAGDFYEYNEMVDTFYGIDKNDLRNALESKKIFLKDIDVNGFTNLQKLDCKKNLLSIFIKVPKAELKRRMERRGGTNIEGRLALYNYENKFAKKYDAVVKNINLDKAVKKVNSYIISKIKNKG